MSDYAKLLAFDVNIMNKYPVAVTNKSKPNLYAYNVVGLLIFMKYVILHKYNYKTVISVTIPGILVPQGHSVYYPPIVYGPP